MSRLLAILSAAAAVAAAGPAAAHHSAAMYDADAVRRLEGVVSAVEWTNPHVWLSVRPPRGPAWHFELPGPGALARAGLELEMFPVGSPVSVEHHPLRDGRPAGQLLSVTLADGRVLRPTGAPPAS